MGDTFLFFGRYFQAVFIGSSFLAVLIGDTYVVVFRRSFLYLISYVSDFLLGDLNIRKIFMEDTYVAVF